MNNPGLNCSVTSCMHNRHGNDCGLQKITVSPCPNCSNGRAQDESMCRSYEAR